MTRCWQYCPDRRPTFPDLVSWSELLLQNSTQYLDLSPSIVNNATYLQPIQTGNLKTLKTLKIRKTKLNRLALGL
jgi:hypothetical protein